MTRSLPIAATLASLFAAAALLAAPSASASDKRRLSGEEKLDKMLEGRVAGAPRSCITAHPVRSVKIIDGTALVYKSGSTLYVNVPLHPQSLDDRDVLVTQRFGSSLCRMDYVTTIDRVGGAYTGNIFLGDFVPYTRQR
ncbi:hypothetical protein [Allopontixanthobacter confluentis]|uniref:hypothetical protein n=1 Tax=Allopontixanthobacter confluentis TaxID=1849021 RepID=UPI002FCDC9D4